MTTVSALGLGAMGSALASGFLGWDDLRYVFAVDTNPHQFPGFFLYYPTRKQQPAALTAVIMTFRLPDDP